MFLFVWAFLAFLGMIEFECRQFSLNDVGRQSLLFKPLYIHYGTFIVELRNLNIVRRIPGTRSASTTRYWIGRAG